MDIENLVSRSRARFNHESARKILKEKYQARMLFAYGGGMWCAGPELLNLLNVCPDRHKAVLLDLYENPVLVDVEELEFIASQRWQEQMNAWLVEHEELAKKR